jgi:hypothetical protein
MAALRGDISFRYLKQFFLVKPVLSEYLYLEVKGQGPMKVITVCDTLPYGHSPTYQINTIQKTIIFFK